MGNSTRTGHRAGLSNSKTEGTEGAHRVSALGTLAKNILAGLSLVVLLGAAACAPTPNSTENFLDLGIAAGDDQGIIGGDLVVDGDLEIGSTVGIYNMMFGQVFCTGTLVAKNLVLTAAHCTTQDPTMLSIYFSAKLGLSTDEARTQKILLPVIAGKTHDQWSKNNFATTKNWGDMALLRFAGDMPAGYKPVRVLANRGLLQKGQLLNLVGFGYTLGKDLNTRAEAMNKAYAAIANPEFSASEILIDQRDGKGACHGDSGGPAYIKVAGELVLAGVTSRGEADPKDTCEQFSVYTSPSTELAWLNRAAAELQLADAVGAEIPQPGHHEDVAKGSGAGTVNLKFTYVLPRP